VFPDGQTSSSVLRHRLGSRLERNQGYPAIDHSQPTALSQQLARLDQHHNLHFSYHENGALAESTDANSPFGQATGLSTGVHGNS
jgi:hypothetical protein